MGIAGFGRLARDYYVPAFRALADARLVAVADPLAGSRSVAARRMASLALFADHREMLERAGLDALLVASPPSTHLAIWNAAAAQGLPVFMEKPFVLAGQLGEVGRGTGSLMLDFNRRFWPTYRRAAEAVQSGAVGRPVDVHFQLHTDKRTAGSSTTWEATRSTSRATSSARSPKRSPRGSRTGGGRTITSASTWLSPTAPRSGATSPGPTGLGSGSPSRARAGGSLSPTPTWRSG
jgi:predicted dehydrogenase